MSIGFVSLVGAGPGDPELITVKGLRRLRAADVVIYDALANEALLRECRTDAELIYAGKRAGQHYRSQDEINALLVEKARAGLQVVRLKGGDPLIFGRVGEEIAALRKANIEFEIVPGITAALGAASSLQLPLTHRQSSHALVFLAGHSASGADPTNWHALVSLGATVVIYMPVHQYSEIARKLRTAGLADETPCAIISRATTSDEQVFSTDVKSLDDAPRLPAPTLLVVGEVLRHAGHRFSPEELGSSKFGSWNCWPLSEPSLVMQAEMELSRSASAGLGDEEQGV
jgi:uroporphyrin-III C-methyltransferase